MCGNEVRIAKRTKKGCKDIFTTSVANSFDRKTSVKHIRFFSTMPEKEENRYTFVAVFGNKMVHKGFIYSSMQGGPNRVRIEEVLQKSCNVLTKGQRCADWFLMKMMITGTMASKIYTTLDSSVDNISDDFKKGLFSKCMDSWFKRFKSNDAMKDGTLNEEPTFEKLANETFIVDAFEVGLLQSKKVPTAGVSHDGVAVVKDEFGLQNLACIEIKTRISKTTIEAAEVAVSNHGRIVRCHYDDEVFKECVLATNRIQVMHQAAITGVV